MTTMALRPSSAFVSAQPATRSVQLPSAQVGVANGVAAAAAPGARSVSSAGCAAAAFVAVACGAAKSRAASRKTASNRASQVPRKFFGGDEDPYEKCSAVKLQVGLQYSKSLLDTLNKLSDSCDTSTDEGLHQLMLDVVLALRRAETSWRYGSVERLVFDSDDPARESGSALQKWGLEAQTKFGDDDEWSKMDKTAPKGVTEYIVMTLLVSCFGPICKDKEKLVVRKSADVRDILEAISGIQVDELTQLDAQWIPEEDGDTFGAMEVTMKFPELAML